MAIINEKNKDKKQRIDTGIRDNASTGDVLADGGDKINAVFDSLYNTFGDSRLYNVNYGIDSQRLYATGYYQKHLPSYYAKIIDMGSRHDIDTSAGSLTIRLPKVKVGESIEFINSNGSINSNRFLALQCNLEDSFRSGEKMKIFRTPNVKITLWGVKDIDGRGVWDYSTVNLFEQSYTPISVDDIMSTSGKEYVISNINEYRIIKMITFCYDDIKNISRSSEIMVHINQTTLEVLYTEYGVVSNTDIEMFDLDFSIKNNNVIVSVKSNIGDTAKFIMKSITTL